MGSISFKNNYCVIVSKPNYSRAAFIIQILDVLFDSLKSGINIPAEYYGAENNFGGRR